MSTEVHMFLAPLPAGANYYREAYPYGPDGAGGFHTDLAIEIDPARRSTHGRALAVVNGLIRLIPDAVLGICTLVLRPDPRALADINATLGSESSVVFVYRNLHMASVRTVILPIMATVAGLPFLTKSTPEQRADAFMAGQFPVSIRAGDNLGEASTSGGAGGWARVGFEVVYIPGGLGGAGTGTGQSDAVWNRVKELIAPSAPTRRLDPMAFYNTVSSAGGRATLVASHGGHRLLSLPSLRTLLEIRDEYDLPFSEAVSIQRGNAAPVIQTAPIGARGTVILDARPPGTNTPLNNVTYQVHIPHSVLTLLPSGVSASRFPSRTMRAPAQWALQAIVMEQTLDVAEEPKSWLPPNTPPLVRYTENNKVTPIRDGIALFHAYANAMRTVSTPGHYIYLAAWALRDQFELIEGDADSTTNALMSLASAQGGSVRALVFDDWPDPRFGLVGDQNDAPVNRINSLAGGQGQAILDDDHLNFGSHHQKFLVVNGSQGAFAFCGGLDINTDRRDSPRHGAEGAFHDVHTRVDGPAVAEIHATFVDRWNNNPKNPPPLASAPPPFAAAAGNAYVQVACTYAPSKRYPFALAGSLAPLNAFLRAVSKARKFIYIEEQYLTPYPGRNPATAAGDTVGVLTALRTALPNIDYLIIVIPNHSDQPQSRYRRQQFIEGLRAVAPHKVHVFFLARQGPRPGPGEVANEGGCNACSGGPMYRHEIYCHSKSWIVDDVCAKIGSCNLNRRSLTHDTEMDIVIVDGAVENGARAFARRYRLELWGEHLNMAGAQNALLEDHKIALSFWLNPPPGAHIRSYDHNAEVIFPSDNVIWDNADPDGR
jgi:phosphatidylserine/phosphatidylglycerophosphate/cardiolipin synthase-like enzyme